MALLPAGDLNWDGEKELSLTGVPAPPESTIDVIPSATYKVTNVSTVAEARYRSQKAAPAANARSLRLNPGASMEWQAPPDTPATTVRTWFWTDDPDGCSLLVT